MIVSSVSKNFSLECEGSWLEVASSKEYVLWDATRKIWNKSWMDKVMTELNSYMVLKDLKSASPSQYVRSLSS